MDVERSGVELAGEWLVVSEHTRVSECGKIVAGYRRITICLDGMSVPPPDLSDRILSACRRPGVGERIRPFPIWRRAEVWRRIAYGCAACLALFLGVSVFFHNGADDISVEDSQPSAMVAQADSAPSAAVASSLQSCIGRERTSGCRGKARSNGGSFGCNGKVRSCG